MQCESCNTEISSKMKAAVRNNSCPYCNGLIMPPMKAEQYLNLVEVLEQTTFTNRSDVDAQIRDKVTGLLMNNFLFKRLELAAAVRDIIVLDEDEEELPLPPPAQATASVPSRASTPALTPALTPESSKTIQKVSSTGKPLNTITEDEALRAPSRSVSDAAKTPRQTSQPISGNGLSARDYAMAQNQTYADNDDSSDPGVDISDLAGLTPEEILTTFPELTTADIEGMISRTTSKLSQQPGHPQTSSKVQRGLTGNGIRRA